MCVCPGLCLRAWPSPPGQRPHTLPFDQGNPIPKACVLWTSKSRLRELTTEVTTHKNGAWTSPQCGLGGQENIGGSRDEYPGSIPWQHSISPEPHRAWRSSVRVCNPQGRAWCLNLSNLGFSSLLHQYQYLPEFVT